MNVQDSCTWTDVPDKAYLFLHNKEWIGGWPNLVPMPLQPLHGVRMLAVCNSGKEKACFFWFVFLPHDLWYSHHMSCMHTSKLSVLCIVWLEPQAFFLCTRYMKETLCVE